MTVNTTYLRGLTTDRLIRVLDLVLSREDGRDADIAKAIKAELAKRGIREITNGY